MLPDDCDFCTDTTEKTELFCVRMHRKQTNSFVTIRVRAENYEECILFSQFMMKEETGEEWAAIWVGNYFFEEEE